MIVLNIDEKKYNLPTNAKEISYKLGKEIEDITLDYPIMDIEGKKWVLAALMSVGYEIVDSVLDGHIESIMNTHIVFSDALNVKHNEYVKIGRSLYKYKDHNPMTVDEYGDKELHIVNNDEEKLFYSLHKKISWYRKPFRRLFTKNHKSFGDINYYQFRASVYMYLQWKNNILNEYAISSHNQNIPDDQQSDVVVATPLENFGIYHIVMTIVNGSLSEYKEWMNEDIRVLFKYVLYQHLSASKSS
jgi:hypothetical protein